MDETNNKPADEDTNAGDKLEALETIKQADAAAERMEAAAEAMEKQNDRAEVLATRAAIGGSSEAGSEPVEEKSEDEKAIDAEVKEIGEATGSDFSDGENQDA